MKNSIPIILTKDSVLSKAKTVGLQLTFDTKVNGVDIAIDVCTVTNLAYVYAADNVLYTFNKEYKNIDLAIIGLNKWLKNANYSN